MPGRESGRESSQSEAGPESRVLASFLLHGTRGSRAFRTPRAWGRWSRRLPEEARPTQGWRKGVRRRLMGGAKYGWKTPPTGRTHREDWEQLRLLVKWPEQERYEEIRPLVLFRDPVLERAEETKTSTRTLYRRVESFDRDGVEGLFATERVRRKALPPRIRRLIVNLKAEYRMEVRFRGKYRPRGPALCRCAVGPRVPGTTRTGRLPLRKKRHGYNVVDSSHDKGKSAARRRRKATGLPKEETAGLPKGGPPTQIRASARVGNASYAEDDRFGAPMSRNTIHLEKE